MVRGVPVLREHDVAERLRDLIDQRHDLIALLHRQTAARNEAVLHIDHQQSVLIARPDLARRERGAHAQAGRQHHRAGTGAEQ